ncbi:patched domain-containing protein 3-like [Lycaon pictus]
MSLSLSKVAPDAWREMGAKGEPEARAEKPEPQPEPQPEARREAEAHPGYVGAGSRVEPLPASKPSQGQEPKLDWASGQHRAPRGVSSAVGDSAERPSLPASPSERQLGSETPCETPCHTDCPEAPLSRALGGLGREVGSQPCVSLPVPTLLTAALGTGLRYLPSDTEGNLEEQCTPMGSPAKAERRFVQGRFTANHSHGFSNSRKSTGVNFVSTLVVSGTASLLQQEILEEISTLDTVVQDLYVAEENATQIGYDGVCAKHQGACVPSTPLLSAWRMNKDLDLTNITFPSSTYRVSPSTRPAPLEERF